MRTPRTFISIAALAALAACAGQPSQRDVLEMPGMQMYQQLCTSCHGAGGKGDGPMAPLLKVDVPDLTRIARRQGGEFPAGHVKRTIDGRFERPAHGLPYMPVWGVKFYDRRDPNDARARARADAAIDRLVVYLRSIQEQ